MVNDYTNILEVYEMFLENLPFAVWIEDIEFKILYLNSLYEKTYGVKYNEVIGKSNEEAFPKDLAKIYNDQIKECITENSNVSKELKKNFIERNFWRRKVLKVQLWNLYRKA